MSYAEICKKSSRKPFTAQHAGEWRANPSPYWSDQFGKARPLAGNLLALWGIKAEPDPPQKADKRFKKAPVETVSKKTVSSKEISDKATTALKRKKDDDEVKQSLKRKKSSEKGKGKSSGKENVEIIDLT